MKEENKLKENRFFIFFQNKKIIIKKINFFLTSIGVAVFIVFFAELILSFFIEIPNKDFIEHIEKFKYEYHPYLSYVNQYRETINPCLDDRDADLSIYFYGGSTMWGLGSKKEETIPSYVAKLLCEEGIVADIRNFGQLGYVNTQEIIKFLLSLRENDIPNLAVFYDGANEALPSIFGNPYMNIPDEVCNYKVRTSSFFPSAAISIIDRVFRGLDLNITKRGKQDFFNSNIQRLYERKNDKDFVEESHYLGKKIIDLYFGNVQIIKSLQEGYGFESLFYWQPTIISGEKKLSIDEKNIINNQDLSHLLEGYRITNTAFKKYFDEELGISDLSRIFDNYYEKTFFIDDCHLNAEGNKIIAKKISEDIKNQLKKNNE